MAALRSWLRANAGFSIVTGAARVLAASPIGGALDWDHPVVVGPAERDTVLRALDCHSRNLRHWLDTQQLTAGPS